MNHTIHSSRNFYAASFVSTSCFNESNVPICYGIVGEEGFAQYLCE